MEIAKKLGIKVLLHLIVHGIQYISEEDEDFEEELMDFEEAVIQWEIGKEEKVYAYFETQDGHATAVMDKRHDKPTLNLAIEDVEVAIDILTGKLEGTKAFMSGSLKVEGDLAYIQKFGMAITTVQKYLGILKD